MKKYSVSDVVNLAVIGFGERMLTQRNALLAMVLASTAGAANAQASQGFIGLVRNLTALSKEAIVLANVAFFLAGLVAIGYGGKLLWDKSNNDRGDDIKMSKIAWCVAGGTMMCAVSFFAAMSVVTAGGSEADMGRRVNIN